MGKSLYIAEKPSVAQEFAEGIEAEHQKAGPGYLESEDSIVTMVCRTSGDYELSGGV